jgi:hypothetical protein
MAALADPKIIAPLFGGVMLMHKSSNKKVERAAVDQRGQEHSRSGRLACENLLCIAIARFLGVKVWSTDLLLFTQMNTTQRSCV